jgi:hypothetical protein
MVNTRTLDYQNQSSAMTFEATLCALYNDGLHIHDMSVVGF